MRKLAALLITLLSSTALPSTANELATGGSCKVQPLSIPLRSPISFNGKTKDEILRLRKQAVDANSDLLLYRYEPSNEVFGQIMDRKPWWGTAGAGAFGKGDKSILGPAEESRFVMNPYLLVAANSATAGIWDPRKLTEGDINNSSFPYFWMPDRLIWDGRNKRATASYDIHGYLSAISKAGKLVRPTMPNQFSLVAYNARDLGYKFIYLDTEASRNVANSVKVAAPIHIPQMLHCGGSCGYPGGCNNMSPFTREIDRCFLTKVPAQAVVKLWRDRPFSHQQDPDFTFVLDFR